MSCSPSPCSRADLALALSRERGIAAFGVAAAEPVDAESVLSYRQWVDSGRHATMDYLARYDDVRSDPRLLLEGASSLVVCAFPYLPHDERPASLPHIARYAMGRDYHETVRERLTEAATELAAEFGGEWRACVDTAPLRERYWAVQSGLGFIGRNCQLIVPGVGSYVFIGTLVTTLCLEPDEPCRLSCLHCGRCVRACPGGALLSDGTFDAARCISYLTIEHRGDLPADADLHGCLYGCDRCQEVCPHNRGAMHTLLPDFEARPALLTLTADDVAAMTQAQFSATFTHSAIKRAKLAGLQRNAARLLK